MQMTPYAQYLIIWVIVVLNYEEDIKGMCDFLAKTLTQKNIDYDNSFEQTIKDYGLITIPITLEHKMRRISNIIKKKRKQLINESLEDSLLDLAGYAILSVIILDKRRLEKWVKKQKKSKL